MMEINIRYTVEIKIIIKIISTEVMELVNAKRVDMTKISD
jgi:hypothetical protein